MNRLILTLAFFLTFSVSFASEKPDYSKWNKLLQKHVSASGKVSYKGFMDDIKEFDDFLVELREKAPQGDWTKTEKKAFYINAYNAYTIKFIITKYPVKSPKDAKFSGKDLWNFKMVLIGPQRYTLDWIENGILRKMDDPRIHFAINCGAKSCPKLLNEAYMPDKLNAQLTKVTKSFVQNSNHNTLKPKKVVISQIFEWYAEDFKKDGLINFLNKYGNVTIEADAKVSYGEYDWALNE